MAGIVAPAEAETGEDLAAALAVRVAGRQVSARLVVGTLVGDGSLAQWTGTRISGLERSLAFRVAPESRCSMRDIRAIQATFSSWSSKWSGVLSSPRSGGPLRLPWLRSRS